MADVKDPKKDSAEGIQQNLLAGKYRTPEELAAAYGELEKKLGQMGNEHRAELEKIKAEAAQVAEAAQWAQQYGPTLVQQVQQQAAALQQLQAMRANGATGQNGNADPLHWIRPEEREALYTNFARQYHQQGMVPYLNQWAQQQALPAIQKMLQDQRDQLAAQHRAGLELMWNAIERSAPADRMEEIRQFQQAMLKFSDPKEYDPRKFAEEDMKRTVELTAANSKIAELEKRIAEREKADAVPVAASGGGVSPFKRDEDRPAPKNREERLRAVVDKTREAVGAEAFREHFNR